MAVYEYCGKHQNQYPIGQQCIFCVKEQENSVLSKISNLGALLFQAVEEAKGKK